MIPWSIVADLCKAGDVDPVAVEEINITPNIVEFQLIDIVKRLDGEIVGKTSKRTPICHHTDCSKR
jgi:hypothetical protein